MIRRGGGSERDSETINLGYLRYFKILITRKEEDLLDERKKNSIKV